MDSDFVVGINKAIDAAKGESHEYPAYLHNTLVTEKLDELTEAISEGGVAHASIDELDDVTISNPQGGECIKYNATTQQWENGDDAGNVQSDWNESDPTSGAYILNKPSIPAAQVQSDWNESDTSDPSYIQNKPDLVKSRVITGEYETTGLPYGVDDYCIYDHKLYKCTTATTGGTFDSDCWVEVTPCVDIGQWGGTLAASTYGIIDAFHDYYDWDSEAFYNSGSSTSARIEPPAWRQSLPTGVTKLDATDFAINRYSVGDIVIRDGVLLECTTATGGEFNPSCWTESSLNGELLDMLKEAYNPPKMTKNDPDGTGSLSINRDTTSLDDRQRKFIVGRSSVAIGVQTISTGSTGTIAEGFRTKSGVWLTGDPVDPTSISDAGGARTDGSHAEGYYSVTQSGRGLHAEGFCTKAGYQVSPATSGYDGIHTEGYYTEAQRTACHAEGYYTKSGLVSYNAAAGTYEGSHAEGYYTEAKYVGSHAEGYYAQAIGHCSHAEGDNTTAQRKAQHVFGAFNVLDTTGADQSAKGSYIEIVGNGTSANARSNARTLDWSGNEVLAGTIEASGFGPTLAGLIPSITVDSGTLIAGNTTVTISNAAITANSIIIPCVDEAFTGVAPTRQATAAGSVTLTFPVQSTDMPVKVVVI